jgi:hypothetical protein
MADAFDALGDLLVAMEGPESTGDEDDAFAEDALAEDALAFLQSAVGDGNETAAVVDPVPIAVAVAQMEPDSVPGESWSTHGITQMDPASFTAVMKVRADV